MKIYALGDRVQLNFNGKHHVTWKKARDRKGTVARLHSSNECVYVLWDGKESVDQWSVYYLMRG